jgi:hypothetical protein
MRIFLLIQLYQLRSFYRWARSRPVSLIAVILSFLFIVFGLTGIIFRVSGLFFSNLKQYSQFGDLTAIYIMAAAAAVSLWFVATSAAAIIIGGKAGLGAELRQSLVLPVSPLTVVSVVFFRSLLTSLSVSSIVFLPVVLAYLWANQSVTVQKGLFVFLSIMPVVLLGESIGGVLGLFLDSLGQKLGRFKAPFFFTAFLIISYILLRYLFPTQLTRLFEAAPEEFHALYKDLPLIRTNLFPLWVAFSVIRLSPVHLVYSYGLSFLFVGLNLLAFYHRLSYYLARDRVITPDKPVFNLARPLSHPITSKDVVDFVRSPSESGYAAFLVSVAVFFILMLWLLSVRNPRLYGHLPDFAAFAVAWMIFFAMTFFIRSIFPLFAREGASAWKLFTAPLDRKDIFFEKLKTALIWALFWFIGSAVSVLVVFFNTGLENDLVNLLILSIPALAIVMITVGAVNPNFRDALDSERLSTTGTGITAVAFGLLYAAGAFYIVRLRALEGNQGNLLLAGILIFMLTVPSVLTLIAIRAVRRYTF